MLECPRCHHDLPDDSDFCQYCGRSITNASILESPDAAAGRLADNPNKNGLGILAALVMVGTLVVLDFGLGSLLATTGHDYRVAYQVSFVLYLVAVALAVLSLVIDHRDRKRGYKPATNQGFAAATIAFSLFIMLLNLQQVILA